MSALVCDICGGNLFMDNAGVFAVCDSCGMKHTKEGVQTKTQEIKGTVKIEGTVETVKGESERKRLHDIANSFITLNDYGKAERTYKQIVNEFPNDAEAWWNIAVINFTQWAHNDYLDCFNCFSNAIQLNSNYKNELNQLIIKTIDDLKSGKTIMNIKAKNIERIFGKQYDELIRISNKNVDAIKNTLIKYPYQIQNEVMHDFVSFTRGFFSSPDSIVGYIGNTLCWVDDWMIITTRISIKPDYINEIDKCAKEKNNRYIDNNKCPSCSHYGKHEELGLFGKCKYCKKKPERF